MIFDQFANLKYRYGNRQFWFRGYYVDTVGSNEKKIAEYVRNQLVGDKHYEQLTMKELIDPFTGEQVTKDKKFAPERAVGKEGSREAVLAAARELSAADFQSAGALAGIMPL